MGYKQVPGMTGTISAGGQYDDPDTSVTSQNYPLRAAEDAAAAQVSADAALASQNAAHTSELAALASQNAAHTSEVNAATSATNSANSASASATSATNSANSASASATSATNSANSATTATNQATIATTQAGIATTQATNAAASATSAAASLAAVNQVFDNFDDIYLGAKSADPTVDNDGNPLVVGQFYWSIPGNEIRFYNGTAWERPEYSATQSALAAAASAAAASTSEANALTYKNNAATSATNAATSETNALSYKNSASTSASTATTQAGIATTQATAAATSATNAAASATSAASSASTATTQATNAAASATSAATSATNAYNYSTSATTTVRNESGATYLAGTVCILNGNSGNKPLAVKAQANSEATSSGTFGVIRYDLSTNTNGDAVTSGLLAGVDTSAYTAGQVLWLSPTTAGGYTTTKPSAPNHAVKVGIVQRSHATQGEIIIAIQNGFELEELHNVAITSVANNNIIAYDSATSLYKNIDGTTLYDAAGVGVAMAIALG
jgi:hypothetical protein